MMEESKKTYRGVVEYFREQILTGEYKVGDKAPSERDIAVQLGISRNSVREAMRVMDMLGIITPVHGSGNYITCNLEKSIAESMAMMFAMENLDFRQISEVRAALESKAYALAIDNATEEEICRMEGYIERLAFSKADEESIMLDQKLHYALVAASKNTLIMNILDACAIVVQTFIGSMRKEIIQDPERMMVLRRCHAQMVSGLRKKDKEKGLKALETHFALVDEVIVEQDDRYKK